MHLSLEFRRFILATDNLQDVVLVQEITEMANALTEAERANASKSQFLANMSHDLRTPLNAILGFSRMVRLSADVSATNRDHLEFVERSGRQLLTLIDDILSISTLEAGEPVLAMEEIDFLSFCEDLIKVHQVAMGEKKITIELRLHASVPQCIRSDAGKVRQVLDNLIGNAVKYSDQGAVELVINRWTACCQEAYLQFEIRDSGQGIHEKSLERVFETFVRADNKREGVGLGLAISRQMVEIMGGEIAVCNNRSAIGTTFAWLLPLHIVGGSSCTTEPAEAYQVVGKRSNIRMLVVDDSRENAVLLRAELTQMGFLVREALSAKEGIEQFNAWKPQMIWMDIQMPDMDGYAATKKIRSLPGGESCNIIAFTAGGHLEGHADLIGTTFDGILLKPYHLYDITQIIEKRLGVVFREWDKSQSINFEQLEQERAELDHRWKTEFTEAYQVGDYRLMKRWVNELKPRFPLLFEKLDQLLNEYRLENLLTVVEPVNKGEYDV
jgi:CheY-like chemotaxis protein/nitrogen-specific signal transduction histidine kinase